MYSSSNRILGSQPKASGHSKTNSNSHANYNSRQPQMQQAFNEQQL